MRAREVLSSHCPSEILKKDSDVEFFGTRIKSSRVVSLGQLHRMVPHKVDVVFVTMDRILLPHE